MVFADNVVIVGAGNNVAKNAFNIIFPAAPLVAHPILQAYNADSGGGVFSINDTGYHSSQSMFATGGGDSAFYALATYEYDPFGGANPPPPNWAGAIQAAAGYAFQNSPAYPPGNITNTAQPIGRKLRGTDSILQLLPDSAPFILAGGNVPFNYCIRMEPTTSPSANALRHYGVIRYVFTGLDPGMKFRGNDAGTDASPIWNDLAGTGVPSPAKKVFHGDLATNPVNPVFTRPPAGFVYSQQVSTKP